MGRSGVRASWGEHANARLREAGHRAGGARSLVLSCLDQQDCCLTAQEIHNELRDQGKLVGLASVYRALELLVDLQLVRRVEMGQATCYEIVPVGGQHHHHVICDGCGEIAAFEDEGLERALERLEKQVSYSGLEHEVLLRGRCPRCTSTERRRRNAGTG